MKRRMRNIIIGGIIVSLALTACGGEKKNKELPADTPWNNGHYAIMETESGYYSNLVGQQHLYYYEKATGTEIFLCAKPECQHDGSESCIATYRNMKVINSLLYDGAIYILAVENRDDVVSFNLYRAALDGSALDKVGEVFSAQNLSDEDTIYVGKSGSMYEPTAFIIHKGYAYIPFFLALKWSEKGFANGGIMKMDIRTGQTEQIYETERLTGPYPTKLWGCGDYIYFDSSSSKKAMFGNGTYRYNILDGSVEYVYHVLYPDQKAYDYCVKWVTEDGVFYDIERNEETSGIVRIERKDGELLHDLLFWLEKDDGQGVIKLVVYDGKIFVYGRQAVSLYDMDGKRLGRFAYDFPGVEEEVIYQGDSPEFALSISSGRLYATLKNQNYNPYYPYPAGSTGVVYFVFSCSIEELAAGNGKWELAYSAKYRNLGYMNGGCMMRNE